MITRNLYRFSRRYFFFVLLAKAQIGEADYSHVRNSLPGLRASQMGGAYCAISFDPSGGFYNPSGIVLGRERETSISANSYQIFSKNYTGDLVQSTPSQRNSASFFPSFIGGHQRSDRVAFGYAFLSRDHATLDQTSVLSPPTGGSFNQLTRSEIENRSWIHAGVSLAFRLTSGFSIGTSQFYTRRTKQEAIHQVVRYTDGGFISTDIKSSTVNEGTLNILGLTLKGASASFGVSISVPRSVSDRHHFQSDVTTYLPTSTQPNPRPNITSLEERSLNAGEINPVTTTLGFALFPSKRSVTSIDLMVHEVSPSQSDRVHGKYERTFNFSLGQEFSFDPIAIRAGAFSNNALTQKLNPQSLNQSERVDYLGFSGGLALIGKSGETSIGYTIQSGKGKAQILSENPEIQDVDSRMQSFSFGGSVHF